MWTASFRSKELARVIPHALFFFAYFTSYIMKGDDYMDNKKITYALNSCIRNGGNKPYYWADLILLYEDGTWEKIFEYRWDNTIDKSRFNVSGLRNNTRSEAIAKLEKAYYLGKIEGIFIN